MKNWIVKECRIKVNDREVKAIHVQAEKGEVIIYDQDGELKFSFSSHLKLDERIIYRSDEGFKQKYEEKKRDQISDFFKDDLTSLEIKASWR